MDPWAAIAVDLYLAFNFRFILNASENMSVGF